MMRFGDDAKEGGYEKPSDGESKPEPMAKLGDMAGKKAGAALASALESGDGAAIYAAFKKLHGLCAGGGE